MRRSIFLHKCTHPIHHIHAHPAQPHTTLTAIFEKNIMGPPLPMGWAAIVALTLPSGELSPLLVRWGRRGKILNDT